MSIPPKQLETILIVTGISAGIAELESTLTASGLSLLSVDRADSALATVRAGGIGLVLLDAAQAGSSSYELCRHLQRASAAPHLPIILLTPAAAEGASDLRDEQKRALAAGASACLRRPFSTGALLELVLAQLPAPRSPDALSASIAQLQKLRLSDAVNHQQAEALREGQNQLLELVARGAPLALTLDKLMRLIETQAPGVLCSTLLLDSDGRTVRTGAGPSLPLAYMAAIDGLTIGPVAGSCGTAMYRKAAVVVSDIENDPLWAPYAAIAAQYGLRACWSVPILLDEDTVLGTFAMYYREVRSPSAADMQLIGVATHLAGIAIARTRHEDELRRHRTQLELLVGERTAELRKAKERAEQMNDELATALNNLSLTQEEWVRREKLAALGALVAGVAHELDSPIGDSLMAASSMAERTRELRAIFAGGARQSDLGQGQLDGYLSAAAQAEDVVLCNLQRAAALLHSFRAITLMQDASQRSRFKLEPLVAALQAKVQPLAIEVILDIPLHLELDSYPGQLSQVLQALLDNSVQHGFEGRSSGQVRISASLQRNGNITLVYADNGKGIAPEHLDHLYTPFFTTRRCAGASGLGLYLAYNIVTGVLGGSIDHTGQVGAGATFTLVLPPAAPR